MDSREIIAAAAGALADRAVTAARVLTDAGAATDDHQVVVDRVAYAATEARVIAELARAPLAEIAAVAAAELAAAIPYRLLPVARALGLGSLAYDDVTAAAIAALVEPAAVEAIGARAIADAGRLAWPLDEML